ncbi:MAG: outer membrane beta-barrel protein [Candidatus Zixiibacteriota bacterium]
MKNLIIAGILVLLLSSMVMAGETPFEKGTISIGADFSAIYAYPELSTISTMPKISFFLTPNLMLGGSFAFDTYNYDSGDMSLFGIGPTVGYYFNTSQSHIAGSTFPFIKGQLTLITLGGDADGTITLIGIEGGFSYMITDKFGLDANVHFRSLDSDNSDAATNFGVGAGFSAFIN